MDIAAKFTKLKWEERERERERERDGKECMQIYIYSKCPYPVLQLKAATVPAVRTDGVTTVPLPGAARAGQRAVEKGKTVR